MTKFVWHDGEWREVLWRAPRPRVHLIRDQMDALKHMGTGELLDSKSAFRRRTRELGFEELGNDAPTTPARREYNDPTIAEDIAEAYRMVEQGYVPPPMEAVPELDGADMRIYSDV